MSWPPGGLVNFNPFIPEDLLECWSHEVQRGASSECMSWSPCVNFNPFIPEECGSHEVLSYRS